MIYPDWLAPHVMSVHTILYLGRQFEYALVDDTSIRSVYGNLPNIIIGCDPATHILYITNGCPEKFRGPMLVHEIHEYLCGSIMHRCSCRDAVKAELAYAATHGVDLDEYKRFRLQSMKGLAAYNRTYVRPEPVAVLERMMLGIEHLQNITPPH